MAATWAPPGLRRSDTAARGARLARALIIAAAVSISPATIGVVLADDPSPAPTPLAFNTPQYLVWMEGHGTYNGPVVDKAYWLFIWPPDDAGNFVVPDGSGGVYHYTGRLIGGPYLTDEEACPAMLAEGVTSLVAWAVAVGEDAQVADCARFLETAAPAPTEGPAGGSSGTGTDGSGTTTAVGEPDAESLGIAVALIGLLLFGGGALGVAIGRRPARKPKIDFGPGARSDVDTRRPTHEAPQEPCAAEAAEVTRASMRGRYLNDLLASCRRHEALLQEQIDVLANLVLPGSVLLDLGFAAGGLSGGLAGPLGRKLIASATFKAAVGEAVVKDLVKELGKQALGSAGGDVDAANLGREGRKSAVKQSILGALKEAIINSKFFGAPLPLKPVKVVRGLGEYADLLKELKDFGEETAGPITEGMGALIDLYEGVTGGLELKERLDQLRAIRDRIADRRADLEVEFEDALGKHRYAEERLTHCRLINEPGWQP